MKTSGEHWEQELLHEIGSPCFCAERLLIKTVFEPEYEPEWQSSSQQCVWRESPWRTGWKLFIIVLSDQLPAGLGGYHPCPEQLSICLTIPGNI